MGTEKKLDLYLVIGLTKESRHWSSEFIDALREKLQPASIQLVDLPGSGRVHHEASPLSMGETVDRARTQVQFHPEHRRVMIAISLGGMMAWEWVTRHPDDFTHFVMINSSLGHLSPVWRRVQPRGVLNFLKIAATRDPEKKEKFILDLCSNNPEKAARIHPEWVKVGTEKTMSLSNSLRQIVAAARFRPRVSPTLPMLVIASKHDRLAHYTCSEAIAREAGAKFVLTDDPQIGHAFHVDGPEVLAETIRGWVGSL